MAAVSDSEQYVGLVLVSHSAEIANGLAGLVAQVAGADVPVTAAGGMPDGSFGCEHTETQPAFRDIHFGECLTDFLDRLWRDGDFL